MAVQEGLTSIRVSWKPPTPLGDTTGYRISYSDGDSSVDVSGGSTDNYLLTDLVMGATYTISIEATSPHLPNGRVETIITLCKMKKSCAYPLLFMFILNFILSLVTPSPLASCLHLYKYCYSNRARYETILINNSSQSTCGILHKSIYFYLIANIF